MKWNINENDNNVEAENEILMKEMKKMKMNDKWN